MALAAVGVLAWSAVAQLWRGCADPEKLVGPGRFLLASAAGLMISASQNSSRTDLGS
jgi:hypothetical protein